MENAFHTPERALAKEEERLEWRNPGKGYRFPGLRREERGGVKVNLQTRQAAGNRRDMQKKRAASKVGRRGGTVNEPTCRLQRRRETTMNIFFDPDGD